MTVFLLKIRVRRYFGVRDIHSNEQRTSEYSKFISSSSLRLTKNIKTMAKLMRLFVVTSGPVQNGPGSFLCKFPKNVGGKEYY